MVNNYQASLSARISEDGIRTVENQIKAISKKYKLNLDVNVNNQQVTQIAKQVEQATNKIKTQVKTKDSLFINKTVENQAFNEISGRIREIRKNIDALGKVSIKKNEVTKQLDTATLTYYNKELGYTVKETMGWHTQLKKVDGTLTKIKTFKTLSTVQTDDATQRSKILEQQAKAADAIEKKEQASYVRREQQHIRFVANREKVEAAQLATQQKNLERVESFASKQSNALKRSVAGKDDLLAKTGLSSEYQSIINDLSKMSSSGGKSIKEMSTRIDEFKTKLKESQAAIKNTTKDGYTFGQMIEIAAKKIAIWAISTGLVYGSLRQLQAGVKYIFEISNAMNEIRIVTGKTEAQVTALASSYNKLAKEMKTSTMDIAKTAADLYRQGLGDNEVEERMKAIVKYAKISSLGLDESQKILTATANATKRDIEDIIDIFAYLGRFCSAA